MRAKLVSLLTAGCTARPPQSPCWCASASESNVIMAWRTEPLCQTPLLRCSGSVSE